MALLEMADLSSSGDSQLWGLPPSLPPSPLSSDYFKFLTPSESPSPSDDASLILINKFDIFLHTISVSLPRQLINEN